MEDGLCYAAMQGDLTSLQQIIARDDSILDRVVVGIFKGKNPLHVAISTGQTQFVFELLRIKPGLAELVDPELGAPLHIASAKGDVEIVRALLQVSPEMCLARDRNSYNPLHVAAIKGQIQVLQLLTLAYPDRARVKVDQDEGETILHLCVKYNRLECLKLLVELIPDRDFVNYVDNGGDTILHLAVSQRRDEMVLHMLSSGKTQVNALNKNGETALDIHLREGGNPTGSGIQGILLNAGAKTRKQAIVEVGVESRLEPEWRSDRRNTFMIVASLIVTMAFQVGMNPPGGVWQDNSDNHVAGKSVLAHTNPRLYCGLMCANTFGFLPSLSVLLHLIYSLPEPERAHRWTLALFTWWIILSVDLTYQFAVAGISPEEVCHGFFGRKGFKAIHGPWIVVMIIVWIHFVWKS